MQAQIRRVGIGLLVAFIAVFFQLNYVQIFAAERIAGNPANIRALLAEFSVKRGDILTVDYKTVAESKATGGRFKYHRTYPQPELYAHITGYYNPIFESRGIEASFNQQLLGETSVLTMQDIEDRFLGSGKQGDDIRLTVDSRLQEAAQAALGAQDGAVVALDPNTGEVRALYSYPSYDPNPLASPQGKTVREYHSTLNPRSPSSPLINKVTTHGYPPGSTFKVVTGSAALDSGKYTPQSTFPDPLELDLPQTDQGLMNFTHTTCQGGGQIDLFTALEISCDTTFAILGLRIHHDILSTAEGFGFNKPIPFDISTEASTFPDVPSDRLPFRAYAAIGQGDTIATPLQMALVTATVANGGIVPRPRLVKDVIDPSGGIIQRITPETLGRAVSSNTASEITQMMKAVVASGTGTNAQIPGVAVAGKTGTAQSTPGAAPTTWFMAFAPADHPQIAVAAVVEHGGSLGAEATGGVVAAPIVKAVIEADRRIRGW